MGILSEHENNDVDVCVYFHVFKECDTEVLGSISEILYPMLEGFEKRGCDKCIVATSPDCESESDNYSIPLSLRFLGEDTNIAQFLIDLIVELLPLYNDGQLLVELAIQEDREDDYNSILCVESVLGALLFSKRGADASRLLNKPIYQTTDKVLVVECSREISETFMLDSEEKAFYDLFQNALIEFSYEIGSIAGNAYFSMSADGECFAGYSGVPGPDYKVKGSAAFVFLISKFDKGGYSLKEVENWIEIYLGKLYEQSVAGVKLGQFLSAKFLSSVYDVQPNLLKRQYEEKFSQDRVDALKDGKSTISYLN